MPQLKVIRVNGHVVGMHSFTDGFVPVKGCHLQVATISEAQVLAMCEHLENQGDPEEAVLLLERFLAISGQEDGARARQPRVSSCPGTENCR